MLWLQIIRDDAGNRLLTEGEELEALAGWLEQLHHDRPAGWARRAVLRRLLELRGLEGDQARAMAGAREE